MQIIKLTDLKENRYYLIKDFFGKYLDKFVFGPTEGIGRGNVVVVNSDPLTRVSDPYISTISGAKIPVIFSQGIWRIAPNYYVTDDVRKFAESAYTHSRMEVINLEQQLKDAIALFEKNVSILDEIVNYV